MTAKEITDEELAAIKARVEAATPGPWAHEPAPMDDFVCDAAGKVIANCNSLDDAHFIADARQAIPALLAEVDHLRAELAERDQLLIEVFEGGRTP